MKPFEIVIIGCSLLILIEIISMWLFLPHLFRLGIRVKADKILENFDNLEIGHEYKTNHAKIKRVSKNSYLFCHRFYWLEEHTPFPIKGEILRCASGFYLIWRIPLGSSLLSIFLLIDGIAAGLSQIFHQSDTIGLVPGIVTIIIFCLAIWLAFKEVERANTAFSELKSLVESPANGD